MGSTIGVPAACTFSAVPAACTSFSAVPAACTSSSAAPSATTVFFSSSCIWSTFSFFNGSSFAETGSIVPIRQRLRSKARYRFPFFIQFPFLTFLSIILSPWLSVFPHHSQAVLSPAQAHYRLGYLLFKPPSAHASIISFRYSSSFS